MLTDRTGFFGAVQFLTRVPVRRAGAADTATIVVWFPVVGALVGALAGGVAAGLGHLVPTAVAAAVGVLVGVLVTGAFHEDGLADTADAVAGGWTVERRLEILKDPRHGTYGVAALCGSIVLRVVAVAVARAGRRVRRARRRPRPRPGCGGRDDGRRAGRPSRRARCRVRPLGAGVGGPRPRAPSPSGSPRWRRDGGPARSPPRPRSAAVAVAALARRAFGGITGDVLGADRAGRRVPRARHGRRASRRATPSGGAEMLASWRSSGSTPTPCTRPRATTT